MNKLQELARNVLERTRIGIGDYFNKREMKKAEKIRTKKNLTGVIGSMSKKPKGRILVAALNRKVKP